MSNLDTYKKQAKLLVRWHRDGNYSIGGRIRGLERYSKLTDREALALEFPLNEAQEIIALEAGYESWTELKAAVAQEARRAPQATRRAPPTPALERARPVLFVRNVKNAAEFYRDRLGFTIDFLHGHPAFYGAVSRDGATLHLKFIHEPVLAPAPDDQELIMAFIEVTNIKGLYAEYVAAEVEFAQKLKKEAWGSWAFIARDLDGNALCFAG